jgi:hypothetical protein
MILDSGLPATPGRPFSLAEDSRRLGDFRLTREPYSEFKDRHGPRAELGAPA